jgi:hypothetical protein
VSDFGLEGQVSANASVFPSILHGEEHWQVPGLADVSMVGTAGFDITIFQDEEHWQPNPQPTVSSAHKEWGNAGTVVQGAVATCGFSAALIATLCSAVTKRPVIAIRNRHFCKSKRTVSVTFANCDPIVLPLCYPKPDTHVPCGHAFTTFTWLAWATTLLPDLPNQTRGNWTNHTFPSREQFNHALDRLSIPDLTATLKLLSGVDVVDLPTLPETLTLPETFTGPVVMHTKGQYSHAWAVVERLSAPPRIRCINPANGNEETFELNDAATSITGGPTGYSYRIPIAGFIQPKVIQLNV